MSSQVQADPTGEDILNFYDGIFYSRYSDGVLGRLELDGAYAGSYMPSHQEFRQLYDPSIGAGVTVENLDHAVGIQLITIAVLNDVPRILVFPDIETKLSVLLEDRDLDDDLIDNSVDDDVDGDELLNAADNCPLIANPDQSDIDGDDLGDVCDPDSDNDGINDENDLDDDNDGIPDISEGAGAVDTDLDGIPDHLDLDSDDDGLFDLFEAGLAGLGETLDLDENGQIDELMDIDANGLHDEIAPDFAPADYDNNGIPNFQALDSDGDGLSDADETVSVMDVDEDGMPNYVDLDSDADGLLDQNDAFPYNEFESVDSDGDGVGDNTDIDDDNDTILDTVEGAGFEDYDQDGIPDALDLDSDNDGIFDIEEIGHVQMDANKDGRVDPFVDDNFDGLADEIILNGGNALLLDRDGNGLPDFRDNPDLFQEPYQELTVAKSSGSVNGVFILIILLMFRFQTMFNKVLKIHRGANVINRMRVRGAADDIRGYR